MTDEIKTVARRHLAADGANLSLRAVARDMGMVSSALYRYFPSRDDLLTALIMDAYNGLGDAVETTARDMPAHWVIHAATMEPGGPPSADVIRRATASTLRRADELGARSLALVAFGTGVGGFPLDEAARIEVEEVRRHLGAGGTLERVVFAVRGDAARDAFEAALASQPKNG